MKRRQKKLTLTRETLQELDARALRHLNGAAGQSIQSGETYCWCTDGCGGETDIARIR